MSDGGDCGGGHHGGDCGHHGGDGGGAFYFGGADAYGATGKNAKPLTTKQVLTFAAVVGAVVVGAMLYREFQKRHADQMPELPQR